MLNGFWKLTWVETKVFMREPMGFLIPLAMPVILFIFVGRALSFGELEAGQAVQAPFNLPILFAVIIALQAIVSLVVIISIYREGGILKRLRATPLSPVTILSAHVFVKLAFTVVSLGLLILAGRQFFPGAMDVHLVSFTAALLLSTLSILSLGFVIASLVPTSRFARPIVAAFIYPMVVLSGHRCRVHLSDGRVVRPVLSHRAARAPSSNRRLQPPHDTRRVVDAGGLGRVGLELGERGGVDNRVRGMYCDFDQGVSLGVTSRSA